MLQAPLKQFQILQLVPINIFFLDLSITNFLLINLLTLLIFIGFIYYNASHKNYLQETSFFSVLIFGKRILKPLPIKL